MIPSDDNTMIDKTRLVVLTAAELFDAWRVIPRLLVAAYGWMCWQIVVWYTSLEPIVIPGCDLSTVGEFVDICIADAPTTQHAALVTVVVGASAAVFGLYANTGRSWGNSGFVKWDKHDRNRGNKHEYEYDSYDERVGRDNNSNRPSRKQSRNSGRRNNHAIAEQGADDYSNQPLDDEGFWDDTER